MTEPHDTPRPPEADDAADLLEVGLDPQPSSPRVAMTLPTPEELATRFPDLEVLELVGQGGMGAVYRVRQRKLDRVAALKVLPRELSETPAFAERFMREARALAKLQHAHIVGVYEFGEKDGLHFLLMEFVDGVTLRQLLSTSSLSPREALAIVPQICAALQYAHEKGVVHRDVKPENILLDRAGRVKVADFGLAKLAEHGPDEFTLTGTGQVMGTVHYMAPEQYRTPGDVDHRADIFSLGVVFYEMLTGDLPVGNFKKPSDAADLGARLDEIVMRTLERERELRYQQASDVEADVQTVITDGDAAPASPARSATSPEPAPRHPWRRWHQDPYDPARPLSRWTVAAMIVTVLAFVIGITTHVFLSSSSWWPVVHVDVAFGLGIVVGAIALTLFVVAAIATGSRRHLVKGHRRSVLGALVLLVVVGAAFDKFMRDEAFRRRAKQIAQQPPNALDPVEPWERIRVVGASSGASTEKLRIAVHDVWRAYVRFVRQGHRSAIDALNSTYYYIGDVEDYLRSSGNVTPELVASGKLGLGVMGEGTLPHPPWVYRLVRIEVDKWERAAVVTASHVQFRDAIRFHLKRADGRWVFQLKPPEFSPPREPK